MPARREIPKFSAQPQTTPQPGQMPFRLGCALAVCGLVSLAADLPLARWIDAVDLPSDLHRLLVGEVIGHSLELDLLRGGAWRTLRVAPVELSAKP